MGWPPPEPRCSHVVGDPSKEHAAGRCRSCYDREWRMSQGPSTPYIKRARTTKALRKVAS